MDIGMVVLLVMIRVEMKVFRWVHYRVDVKDCILVG